MHPGTPGCIVHSGVRQGAAQPIGGRTLAP